MPGISPGFVAFRRGSDTQLAPRRRGRTRRACGSANAARGSGRRRACPARHDSVMTWWREGSIYQVYPRSFQDATATASATSRASAAGCLLAWLGVDAVWLSPFYRSPMVDFGYDVVRPQRRRSAVRHARGLGRAGRRRARARPAADPRLRPQPHLRPASVVRLAASGATGTCGATTPEQLGECVRRQRLDVARAGGAYYYHAYLPAAAGPQLAQPRGAGGDGDVLRFWLARGVDGFRVDALRQTIKDGSGATTRRTRAGARATTPTTRCSRVHDRSARGAGRRPPACAATSGRRRARS